MYPAHSIAVIPSRATLKRMPARCGKTQHPVLFTKWYRSERRGGQRMLDAGVAVADGNLGSQGPVIPQPVGGDRWFCSTRVAAPE
jgi:hypothetical protein